MQKNKWLAIGFAPAAGAAGEEMMKGDFALLRAPNNDDDI
jgi:hypothetical protein